METLLANLAGKTRKETWDGREWLVVPATSIVPGVLNGSQGPLYYPEDEIGRDVSSWDGMPVTLRHPMLDGRQVSARRPDILEKQGLGTVFASVYNGKLQHELWFDVARTRRLAPAVLAALQAERPVELSTGLYLTSEPSEGIHNGRAYTHIARGYRPDHIAVLPDGVGACSLADGCGVLVNEDSRNAVQRFWDWLTGNAAPGTEDYLLRSRLHAKLALASGDSVDSTLDGIAVYRQGGKTYKRAYTLADDEVTLAEGEPEEVRQVAGYYRKPRAAAPVETVAEIGAGTETAALTETATVARNAFCPTGKGGGVDASCSPGGGASKSDKGGKGKEADVKIKAAADKVAKINAKVDKAKAALEKLKGELKGAKADLARVKETVKKEATTKGPTKADVKAKETATALQKLSDTWASAALAREGGDKRAGKTIPKAEHMEGKIKDILGTASAHKVAKELGLGQRFKSSEAAAKAVVQKVIHRVGAIERVSA